MHRKLGRRLTDTGALDTPDHVFFLQSAELAEASAGRAAGTARPDLAELARERYDLRESRKRLNPPLTIPPDAALKFGPFRLAMFEPPSPSADDGAMLTGVAVSPGQVIAAASVVRSPAEFDHMLPDTVLVCTTTTPAWTPLFSEASGLVTDIGGALAHGSIVAREYGIPAVMGTGVATKRITGRQRIEVDGDAGMVTVLDAAGAATPVAAPTAQPQRPQRRVALAALAIGVAAIVLWKTRRSRRAAPRT